ncbi:MAG: TIM barrel protein [Thaumarchaeota archaeon]|nr:TIM barrel protein [Nitrososphaerota archaeon]
MTSTARWRSPPVEEAIAVLREAGYDGVEWMLGQHFRDAEELEELAGRTRRSGLAVSNIMCWQDLVTRDDASRTARVKTLQRMVSAAGDLDIPVINIFTGR